MIVVKQICPDTKRELKTLIDTEEVVSAREEILHEIEGYDDEDAPIFRENGEVSSVCSIVFRNSHSLRFHDPNLVLLGEIQEAKLNNYADGVKEVFLGMDINYDATNVSPGDDDNDVEFVDDEEEDLTSDD